MYKILISTIIRNQEQNLHIYYAQLKNLVSYVKDVQFELSLYQNDSSDNTKEILYRLDFGFIPNTIIIENLNSIYYDRLNSVVNQTGSNNNNIKLIQRLNNLSNARNITLKALDNGQYEYVLIIQPDAIYNFKSLGNFIMENIPKFCDIISPASIIHRELYDKWATRIHKNQKWFDINKYDIYSNIVYDCYSTFNCFCLYNAEPFYQGARFGYIDKDNNVDCDTVIICQRFRQLGYTNIKMDTKYKVLSK